jgi:hypothetical protein
MVAHACNPATWKVEIEKIVVPCRLGKKLLRSPTDKLGMVVCACNLSLARVIGKRIMKQVGQNPRELICKII